MVQDSTAGRSHPRWQIPRAKITVPRVPTLFVQRTPLRDSLDRAVDMPVTVVSAPPGYGKTLMLADWVAATGQADKAWVSLDNDDNDVHQFWSALLSAMCACEAVPADSRLNALVPPSGPDVAGFLDDVVDAIDALPGRLCLVLDDLHEVVNQETLHGIATIIRHQPTQLRLVLSSRFDPPLPMARLRVQGRLAEIRANRLRFSEEDAAELMRTAGVDLDHDQLRQLVEQTYGWAAGLRLAARSLWDVSDRDAFLADFASNDRSVADYLIGEVLNRLTDETREFLWVVSICDEMTPSLAAQLSGRDDAGVVLAALERESSLLMGIDDEPSWYRIHPLLRAYLRADLDRQRPELATDLHGIAAAWFAAEDRPHLALYHAGQTGNEDAVVALLRRHAVVLLLRGSCVVVRNGLATLGADTVTKDAWLSLISALAHVEMGEPAVADSALADSAAAWPERAGSDLLALHDLVSATHALACGRPPAPGSMELPAPGSSPDSSPDGAHLGAWGRCLLGCALLYADDRQGARRELDAAHRLARDRGLDFLVVLCLTALAAVSALDGDYEAIEEPGSTAIAIARERGWRETPPLAASHVALAFSNLMRANPAKALYHSTQAARSVDLDSQPGLRFVTGLVVGAARFDQGDRSTGQRLMAGARNALAEVTLAPEVIAAAALVEHRAAVFMGQGAVIREVLGWAQARVEATAEASLMKAWTMFAHGDIASAHQALQAVLDDSLRVLCPTTLLEGRLLESGLAIRAGERTNARRALSAALVLAEPAGAIRPFAQAPSGVRRLLVDQMGGFGRAENFAIRVHRALSELDAGRTGDPLTERERVVLAMLTSHGALDEVASHLAVSVNTVKTHVRAIYAKLGVNSRRAAIVAARGLGLA